MGRPYPRNVRTGRKPDEAADPSPPPDLVLQSRVVAIVEPLPPYRACETRSRVTMMVYCCPPVMGTGIPADHAEGNPGGPTSRSCRRSDCPRRQALRSWPPTTPMPMKLLLESAHVVLGGEFFAGGVEDAHLLVVGSGSLLVLGGAPTGVAPGKDGDDGGQRQQRCGAGQYPRGGQHGGILLTNSHVPPCTAWVLPHLS